MYIDIDGVEFSYSSTPVLKDVTAYIGGPSFVSILGPNGVGKSTLIHCINKILTPTKGTVYLDERDVKDISIKDLAKEMGYVPYSANDTFPLTVVDTVMMGRHPHSKWGTLDKDLDIVYETLDLLGISDLAMRQFNELSAGQHQKVMLARGLAQDPQVLLLDEPTSNLDVKHQLDVTKLLKRLSVEKQILVIMICHDINIAAKYSDQIILLNDGTVFAVGTPAEVITERNLEVVYGVRSQIIDDDGRPHVILKDTIETPRESGAKAEAQYTAYGSAPVQRRAWTDDPPRAIHQNFSPNSQPLNDSHLVVTSNNFSQGLHERHNRDRGPGEDIRRQTRRRPSEPESP